MNNRQKSGRLTLLFISALFFTPILLAMYLYFSDSSWRPTESIQHGELITPPIALPDVNLNAADDSRLRGVWSLLVLADAQCDSRCLEALEHARQIRLSLGPKMTRLQTVFLPAGADAAATPDRVAFPMLIIATPDAATQIHSLVSSWENGQIFLVDPLGNLMMSYPPAAEMADVRKDLGHLLKISEIG